MSAVFIALYAFIVTPVSIWHHHTIVFKGTTQKVKESTQPNSLDNTSGVSCKICAHHYSVFDNDASLPIIASAGYLTTQSGITLPPHFVDSHRLLSDRAPPAI